jgi:ABC-type amino acid transport substrate-binding protein
MSIFIKIVFLSFLLITSLVSNDKVTLQLKWFHQFQFAGYYAAKEKGFYDEVGLDVEIKERNSKINNIEQVINGEATYGIADSILLLYKAKDKPVVIVSPIFQHSAGVVYSLKEKQLNSPYKFDGKDMLFYENDTDGFAILGMLKHLNIIPNLIRDREKNDHLKLLKGEVDLAPAYLGNELFYFKEKNIEINIINPSNYGFDLYGDMIFTTQNEAQNNPTRVRKFKEASIKGWKYALNNQEEIIQLIKRKYNQEKSLEHLRYEANIINKLITKDFVEIGTIDEGRISYIFNLYKSFGLTNNNLNLESFIFKEYSEAFKDKIKLTPKEIQFLKDKPSIKVSNELDWAPFDFAVNDKPMGYSIDLLNLIAKKLDLKVEYINGYTWDKLISLFKNRELDLLHSLAKNKERIEFGIFTKPYIRYQTHFVTRLNHDDITQIKQVSDKTFVVGKNWAIDNYLTKNYPQLKIIRVSTLDEILNYVSSGKADIAILNKNVANYHIKKRNILNLKTSSWFKNFDKNKAQMLHFLTQKDQPLLASILNKALESLTLKEIEKINNKWFNQINNKYNINHKEAEFISNNTPIRFKVSRIDLLLNLKKMENLLA